MSQHTPGPWKVAHNSRLEIMPDSDEWVSAIAHIYTTGRVNANSYRMPAEENARLIAAAPDLLAACEQVVDNLNRCWEWMQDQPVCHELALAMLERARAAIAKAEGRE